MALKEVNLLRLIAEGGLSIILYWLIRSLRWHLLLKGSGMIVPFFDVYMCTAVSLAFSIFTPLQSGEVLKVELLRKYGMLERFPGYGSFLVERALDLATVLTIACISLLTTFSIPIKKFYLLYFIAALISAGAAGIFALHKLKSNGKVQLLLNSIFECVREVPNLVLVILITCISWASVAFICYIFLHCGSLQLDFLKTVALMSTITLIGICSLIPGGLGISEAGTSQVLVWFGFASTAAQTGSLVLRFSSLVAAILGVAHLLLWRLMRRHRNRQSAELYLHISKNSDTGSAG